VNRNETWALFKQGKDAWNAWAKDMLAKRKVLEEVGEWSVSPLGNAKNDTTMDFMTDAAADFSGRTFGEGEFPEGVDFSRFVFPGDANFREAVFRVVARFGEGKFERGALFTSAKFDALADFYMANFEGEASFAGARFGGNAAFAGAKFKGLEYSNGAQFDSAEFEGYAAFPTAEFKGPASFVDASFGDDARFWHAKFRSTVDFHQAAFADYTSFENALFGGRSIFGAIEVKRAFILTSATFRQVPDFIQANFAEAPRLDDLSIEPQSLQRLVWLVGAHLWKRRKLGKQRRVLGAAWRILLRAAHHWKPFSREMEREARWRSVKKLANEAHDHAREQEFFAEELKARRNPGSFKEAFIWLVSLLYQGLSNFGRSLLLPFIWLAVTVMAFEGIYLNSHWDYVADKQAAVQACVVGSEHSHAESAAFALSLRNTLPFAGLGGPEKLNQIYRCLYGVEGTKTAGFPETRLPPHIPDNVAVWSFFQTILSAVLIFLFLLAVRNHFRIR